MVCAKFQDHGTSGSVEDFLKVEAIYGHGSHLGYVIKTIFINLCPPTPSQGGAKNLTLIGQRR